MSRTKGSREPVDQQSSLSLTLYPWTTHTVAEVDLGWRRDGATHRSRLAYWHLDVTRADLAGRATDDVIRILVDGLLRHLDGSHDPADAYAVAAASDTGEATGAPLGAMGGTVTQDSLPGI